MFVEGHPVTLKLKAGDFLVPVTFTKRGSRLFIECGYNKKLIEEIKGSFSEAKWHGYDTPPRKQWSVLDNPHTQFQIAYLAGMKPYAPFDAALPALPNVERNGQRTYDHQMIMTSHMLTRQFAINAGEMGTGKTLATILAMELTGAMTWLWVGPKSSLFNIQKEFKRWGSRIYPHFVNYHNLKSLVENWPSGRKVYQGIVFDEGQKLKTITSQRSIAAAHLCDAVRNDWTDKGYIFLLSGTPAPKYPLDWYSLCEIVRPGFLREGSIHKFKERLAIVKTEMNPITGGSYPKIVGWRDSSQRCNICGTMKAEHELMEMDHPYQGGVNEIELLYERMKGLVLVTMKKDCLQLPDKIYRKIGCEPSKSTLNAARIIAKTTSNAAKALVLLRELSDGFQYIQVPAGEKICDVCHGRNEIEQPSYCGPEKTPEFLDTLGIPWTHFESIEDVIIDSSQFPQYFNKIMMECPNCHGKGTVTTYDTSVKTFDCPKDGMIIDLMDEFEEIGRMVVYAGFTGSVDKLVDICKRQKWDYIRLDGRGWESSMDIPVEDLVEEFQNPNSKFDRIMFIGNPAAASTSLTLTASNNLTYYSNSFNADDRIQSEDRIHRIGMDVNRGAIIIDLIHLPTDEYVLANLKEKRRLQDITMGQVKEALERESDERYGT